jgi:hypothetical protein
VEATTPNSHTVKSSSHQLTPLEVASQEQYFKCHTWKTLNNFLASLIQISGLGKSRIWGISRIWISIRTQLFFAVLGLELRAFNLSHSTSPIFVTGLFKIRSPELFAQAGFEL